MGRLRETRLISLSAPLSDTIHPPSLGLVGKRMNLLKVSQPVVLTNKAGHRIPCRQNDSFGWVQVLATIVPITKPHV